MYGKNERGKDQKRKRALWESVAERAGIFDAIKRDVEGGKRTGKEDCMLGSVSQMVSSYQRQGLPFADAVRHANTKALKKRG